MKFNLDSGIFFYHHPGPLLDVLSCGEEGTASITQCPLRSLVGRWGKVWLTLSIWPNSALSHSQLASSAVGSRPDLMWRHVFSPRRLKITPGKYVICTNSRSENTMRTNYFVWTNDEVKLLWVAGDWSCTNFRRRTRSHAREKIS